MVVYTCEIISSHFYFSLIILEEWFSLIYKIIEMQPEGILLLLQKELTSLKFLSDSSFSINDIIGSMKHMTFYIIVCWSFLKFLFYYKAILEEIENFKQLGHSPSGCNSQEWSSPKPGTHVGLTCGCKGHGLCSQDSLVEKLGPCPVPVWEADTTIRSLTYCIKLLSPGKNSNCMHFIFT